MNNKIGQLSLFVILGAIILVGGVVAYVSTSSTAIFEEEKTTYKIKEFTEGCLISQSEYALREIAKKGGWYYSKSPDIYAKENHFNTLVERSIGFEHPFYSKLDYWSHFDESSKSFETNIPSLDDDDDMYSIKNQATRLIEETINKHCIQDYVSFNDKFIIETQLQKLEVKVNSFENEKLVFDLFLPVSIESRVDGTLDGMNSFRVEVPNLIKTPYYISKDVVLAHHNQSFIEKAFLNFIYIHQKTGDKDYLPPFYDFKYGVADYTVTYAQREKPLVKNIFSTYSSEIIILDLALTSSQYKRVDDTLNAEFKPAQNYQNMYLSLVEESYLNEDNLRRDYEKYVGKFVFEPFYPLSLSFSNGKGGGQVVTNKVFNEVLLIIPIQHTTYQTGYDITAPILFQISRPTANPDNQILFNLPLEVNIRNNNALKELLDEGFLRDEYEVDSFTTSYCDAAHHISKDIVIDVNEKNIYDEKVPLDGVSFRFTCPTDVSTACSIIPKNSVEGFNSQKYTLNLPINCPNAQIEISKEGYLPTTVEVSPSISIQYNKSATLLKPTTLDLFFTAGGTTPGINQEAILIFEPMSNPEYIQVYGFDKDTNYDDLNITLIPDTYKITSLMFDNSTRTIPGKPGKKCSTLSRLTGCEDKPELPAIDLEGWVLSNFELENYVITQEDLRLSRRIVAQIPGVSYPRTYDDFNQNMPESLPKYIKLS